MLGLVDTFSDKRLAFLWEQTVPHCLSIPIRMSLYINSLRKAKESLPESSISHIITRVFPTGGGLWGPTCSISPPQSLHGIG